MWPLLALLATLALSQPAAPAAAPLRLGLMPAIAPERERAELQPVADFLTEALHRPVELVVAKDYADISGMISRREVDFAILFPLAFAQAEGTIRDVKLVGCSVRQGKADYRGYIVTRRDSSVHSLGDLAGKKVGFVDKGSTSGYLYPVRVMVREGLAPGEAELARVIDERFLKSHDAVLLAVSKGEVDAGAVYDGAVAQATRIGVDPGQLRILARTDPIPHEAVVAAPGVSDATREAFRGALLSLDTRTAKGRAVLRPMVSELKLNGFVACDDHVFDPVRQAAERGRP